MQYYPSGEIRSSKPGLIHPIQYTHYVSSSSFHIYSNTLSTTVSTHTAPYKRSIDALSTAILKWFRSLKALFQGSWPVPPTFSEGPLRNLPLEKLSFPALLSNSPSPTKHGRKLPTFSNTFQVGICAASACFSFWRALQLGSPAEQAVVTDVLITSLYPPKSSQVQLPRVWSCRGKGWKVTHPPPPFPLWDHDIHNDQMGFPLFKTRRFVTSLEVRSHQPLLMKCYNFLGTMWQESHGSCKVYWD